MIVGVCCAYHGEIFFLGTGIVITSKDGDNKKKTLNALLLNE